MATAPRERNRSTKLSRAIEEIDDAPLPTFDQAKAIAVREREQALATRLELLEAGEPIVRMVREPNYYGLYVARYAAMNTVGGDCRPEIIRENEPKVRHFLTCMFAHDRARYAELHGIQSLELPAFDPAAVALMALRIRVLKHLRAASREPGLAIGPNSGRPKVMALAAEVEERTTREISIKVEVELDWDRAEHQITLERIRTLRVRGENIDTKA